LRRALVTDVGLSPSLRGTLKERHGIDVFGCYATADLGLLAYESTPHEGLIVDEAVIVEIVRPGSGEPVDDGEVGEVVVTSFNPDYPLIRFATGDLSAFLPGLSACGRSNRRLRGRLGRLDEAATVEGRVIAPWDLAAILERHALDRGRIVVERANGVDRLRLIVEGGHGDGLADALAASVREVTRLAGEVEIVDPGSLANDGKVIDDRRG
jgi:phenylacetate-CoA ligase